MVKKITNTKYEYYVHPFSGDEFFRVDRWTDRHDETNSDKIVLDNVH